ncbi:ABC transporter ATP-binding protein [Changchengzhania lutea]|uniref:ABC transporter ATP-binding protein n=1 Tax=Changchengzhania lutea TaxID=2049305 RepID=UPI00115C6B07|nr:ABC transporter ATP-binding protein [Changchengzhania lutea]
MQLSNEVVLRPRFQIKIPKNNASVLKDFDSVKMDQSDFVITRIDDHVFIKFPKKKQHFWSPKLHLEINEVDEETSLLYGLFGPSPTVWTLFMFLHFMVAGLFIAAGIWAYTNWRLEHSYAIQVSLMLFMIIIWFALYFGGRIGKASSKHEMHELNNFMNTVLNKSTH